MSNAQQFALLYLGLFLLLTGLVALLEYLVTRRRARTLPPPHHTAVRSLTPGCAGVFDTVSQARIK